jgi:hypothetical protein
MPQVCRRADAPQASPQASHPPAGRGRRLAQRAGDAGARQPLDHRNLHARVVERLKKSTARRIPAREGARSAMGGGACSIRSQTVRGTEGYPEPEWPARPARPCGPGFHAARPDDRRTLAAVFWAASAWGGEGLLPSGLARGYPRGAGRSTTACPTAKSGGGVWPRRVLVAGHGPLLVRFDGMRLCRSDARRRVWRAQRGPVSGQPRGPVGVWVFWCGPLRGRRVAAGDLEGLPAVGCCLWLKVLRARFISRRSARFTCGVWPREQVLDTSAFRARRAAFCRWLRLRGRGAVDRVRGRALPLGAVASGLLAHDGAPG